MVCALTPQQQRALFSKVVIDLDRIKDFSLDEYIRGFYDQIMDKTNDPVLATMYVGLIPMNIRAVGSVSNKAYALTAGSAAQIAGKEIAFEDYKAVQEYINSLGRQAEAAAVIKKAVVEQTQVQPTPQQTAAEPGPEPENFNPPQQILLSDLSLDTDLQTGQLRPGMKFWADTKVELIKNYKPDGTSSILGAPVRVQMMQATDFRPTDFYPDTQAGIQANPESLSSLQKGVMLVVTDLDGKLIRFNQDLQQADDGQLVHYNFRNPQEGQAYLESDKRLVRQYQGQGITEKAAIALVNRQLALIKEARAYISRTGKPVQVHLHGGTINYVAPTKKGSSPVSALKIVTPLAFYAGNPEHGQQATVYYFNIPGTNISIPVNKKEATEQMQEKLISLMVSDLEFTRHGKQYKLSAEEKLRLWKQFVYTDPGAVLFKVENGKLQLFLMGELQNLTPEELGNELRRILTRRIPAKKLTVSQAQNRYAGKANRVTELSKAQFNDIYEVRQPDGTTNYYEIDTVKLPINRQLFNNNKFDDFEIQGNQIQITQKDYFPFIQENFTVPYQIDSQGGLQSAGSHLSFSLLPSAQVEVAQPEPESVSVPEIKTGTRFIAKDGTTWEITKKNKDGDYQAKPLDHHGPQQMFTSASVMLGLGPVWNKTLDQTHNKATQEQIQAAQTWYESSPMSRYFPFRAMFEKVNQQDSSVIAQWTQTGITLLSGSDMTDLYHEAWHGFTQGLMTHKERAELYYELRKNSGGFVAVGGAITKFKDATNLELEEYLAEDFRQYMLSGGKSVMDKAPKRNTFFRRLFNFLKELFGSSTTRDAVTDERVNTKIAELYQKLRLGNLEGYSFSAENAQFNTLNKAMQPTQGGHELSFEVSDIISSSLDSIFSEALDGMNAAALQDRSRKADLEQKPDLSDAEKAELQELQFQYTSWYSSRILDSLDGLSSLYQRARTVLEQRLASVRQQHQESPTRDIERVRDILQWALDNYGDPQHPELSVKDKGVIGYHTSRSVLISSRLQNQINDFREETRDNLEMEARELAGKNAFENKNDTVIYDLVGKEIRAIVSSLFQPGVNQIAPPNILGFPKLVDFRQAWAYIMQTVQNSLSMQEMYQRLQQEQTNYPPIGQLLRKLGPLSSGTQTQSEADLWVKFYQSANKYRILLRQTEVAETRTKQEDGKTTSTFDIKIGNALAETKKINYAWASEFQKGSGRFMGQDQEGAYLDTTALLEKYKSVTDIKANPYQFLRDVGINLSNLPVVKQELEKKVASGDIRLGGIWENIWKLHDKKVMVRGIGSFLNQNRALDIKGQVGPRGNYGKILQLESQYSGQYSDFMVNNAEGEKQSEYNQPSSLTRMVSLLNAPQSLNELLNQPQTSQFNPTQDEPGRPFNAYTRRSIWVKAMFDLGKPEGPRYPDSQIQILNLSGSVQSINGEFYDGLAQSSQDELTRIISDLHQQTLGYTPEMTRHAGKSTSMSVSLPNYRTGTKNNPRLYIDTVDFLVDSTGYLPGLHRFTDILTEYLHGEVDRIRYAQTQLARKDLQYTDWNYLKRAAEFHSFSGILSSENKKAILSGTPLESLDVAQDIQEYLRKLVKQYQAKTRSLGGIFLSPSLLEQITQQALEANKQVDRKTAYNAIVLSFLTNNWIHHFEEMILLYGDIAQYKDFFKRNASINSPGDIIPSDPGFQARVNQEIQKPLAQSQGIQVLPWNSFLRTAVVKDSVVKSAYLEEYLKASPGKSTEKAYGGVNEADAGCYMALDTYRILSKGYGIWTDAQEDVFQQIVKQGHAKGIKTNEFFPVLKLGHFGPLYNSILPMTALHKFAVMPAIPGISPNLDAIHNKMMAEGIDYVTFESGSKVAIISGPGGPESLYADTEKRQLSDAPFIPNIIHTDFLKYQVAASNRFKGKVTLISQLRKLVLIGMNTEGTPTDYQANKPWNSLNEKEKLKASQNYTRQQAYIKSLHDLVGFKKTQLLRELGVHEGGNAGDIKLDNLLELISAELERSDVGEHEWTYIQTLKGGVKNPLDISPSAEMIDKVITALANKRLVTPKVKGEQFVLVPSTLWEDTNHSQPEGRKFTKPTQEDLAQYGTSDLPTYHLRNGRIQAAKVKIAMQGDFKLLLNHPDVVESAKQNKISRLQALNGLLKGSVWLEKDNNRYMVTMVGARVPTQGPNSDEFVEVWEFLPEVAGNILIAPPEITAKTGGDFDYDKLPLLMPHIRMIDGVPVLAEKIVKKKAQQLHEQIVSDVILKSEIKTDKGTRSWKQDKAADKLLSGIFGESWDQDYTDEEIQEILREQRKKPFEEYYADLNGEPVLENNIILSMLAILERPENFPSLIRPNDTDLAKPLAEKIRGDQTENNLGTRMYEPLRSLEVQQSNSVGKDALGIGAINNSFNAIAQAIGLHTRPTYNGGMRAQILMPHNKLNGGISLSATTDLNQENIAEVISQLINGWVDVEKDDWIHYIQGNKELAPIMLFLVRAGVPLEKVVKFITSPVIQEYIQGARLQKSPVGKVFGAQGSAQNYRNPARKAVLKKFGLQSATPRDISILAQMYTQGIEDITEIPNQIPGLAAGGQQSQPEAITNVASAAELEKALNKKMPSEKFGRDILSLFRAAKSEMEVKFLHRKFTLVTHPDRGGEVKYSQELNNALDEYKKNPESKFSVESGNKKSVINPELATLLHFLEIEMLTLELDKYQRAFNIDTNKAQDFFEFTQKVEEIKELQKQWIEIAGVKIAPTDPLIPVSLIEKTLTHSPVGPFYVHEFVLDVFSRVMPLRNNKHVQDGAAIAIDAGSALFNKDEVATVRNFKSDLILDIFQRIVRDGPRSEKSDPVPGVEFASPEEAKRFWYRRAEIEKMYPTGNDFDYQAILDTNRNQVGLRQQDESDQDFKTRMEAKSYQDWINEKTLYDIFSPWQLYRAPRNVATRYQEILNRYPQLRPQFSLLGAIKQSSTQNMTNLQLTTTKLEAAEINRLHQNMMQLANANVLMHLEGVTQQDADYISGFFKQLPLYLYMQAGPNTRNPFSFARIIPVTRIQRLIGEEVKHLSGQITPEYVNDFVNRFLIANADQDMRNRFKEYIYQDETANDNIVGHTSMTEEEWFDNQGKQTKPMQTEMKFAEPAIKTKTNSGEYVNHSGGALGSDTAWDTIGREFGVTQHNHYWMNEKTPSGNQEITKADAVEGQKKVTEAARQMGRIEPTHQVRDERLIRNWSQVKYANAVFAITTMMSPGDIMNHGKEAKIRQGKGGTGYAIQMAINEGKPVYVFDQERQEWFKNINGVWSKSSVPVLTKNFAGIGTRELNESGRQAIRDVYARTIQAENPETDSLWNQHSAAILKKYPDLTQTEFESMSPEGQQKILNCI